MLGIKCVVLNTDVVKAGHVQHLLMVPAGDNVIRLLPPLNIPDEDISEAIARLGAVAQSLRTPPTA